MVLIVEQLLNGLQLGVMLFMLAAGLTLVFGVMGVINLAHGSFYMFGAYGAAVVAMKTGSTLLAVLAGLGAAAVAGMIIEFLVLRRLYQRDHLDQVLATFALILFFNQMTALLFGRQPLFIQTPGFLAGTVPIIPGLQYPIYRLVVIAVGLSVAAGLYVLINKTRIGMLLRAGATHRQMVRALGVDVRMLYTVVFGIGALLAGLAGIMAGPIYTVQVGMGEQILIMAFVVVVIGGIGSVRGALFGALIIGVVDTMLRAFLPGLLRTLLSGSEADALAAGLSSMGVYFLMAIVLLVRPKGLFPADA